MLRFLTRLIGILLVIVVLLVGALFLLPGERLARIASDQITAATGREVVLAGSVRPTLFPALGVQTGAFSVAGDPGQPPLIRGEALTIAVDLAALLQGQVRVQDLTLVRPVVQVAPSDQNASTSGPSGGAGASPDLGSLSLDKLSVIDGRISVQTSTGVLELTDLQVTMAAPDMSQPVTMAISAQMRPTSGTGHPLTAEVTVDDPLTLSRGDAAAVGLAMTLDGNSIGFDGTATARGAVQGALDLDLGNLGWLLAEVGADLPPQMLPLAMTATLDAGPEAIALTGGSYRLGANRLAGDVSIALDDIPAITARLSGDRLDVSYLSNAEQGSGDAASGTGWSKDPIDASGLSAANADIRLNANQIDFGETLVSDAQMAITLDRARLVTELTQAQAFGGSLTGQFVVNNRNGLSVGGRMNGRTVAVSALLSDLAGFDRLAGLGDADLRFLGVGPSLDHIMKSLSGEGQITVGEGQIRGFDLEAMLSGQTGVSDAATTIFNSMGASFVIEGGVLRNSDLAVAASVLSATGAGRLDLGNQTLDYELTPRLTGLEGSGAISLPVRISGPWAAPRIRPDFEALARQQLEAEAAKIEAEAKARLAEEKARAEERLKAEQQKLQQRLQAEQDKIEDRARDALGKALGGLLGGN